MQYVGDRMEATGRLAKALNKLPTSDQEHAGEYMPKTFDEFKDMLSGKTKSYGVKYLKAIPIKVAKKYYETSYDKKDLIKDLKYIKQAMKTA